MGGIGYAGELKDSDLAVLGLIDRLLEVIEFPGRPSVAGGRNEQRMIPSRRVGEAATFLVGILGTATAAGEPDAQILQDWQRSDGQGIGGIGEAGRSWKAVLLAAIIDPSYLCGQVPNGLIRDGQVIPRVVADLEAILVELSNFLPGHVVASIGRKVEALGDKEGGSEAMLLEERPYHGEMGFACVVEGEDHEL